MWDEIQAIIDEALAELDAAMDEGIGMMYSELAEVSATGAIFYDISDVPEGEALAEECAQDMSDEIDGCLAGFPDEYIEVVQDDAYGRFYDVAYFMIADYEERCAEIEDEIDEACNENMMDALTQGEDE